MGSLETLRTNVTERTPIINQRTIRYRSRCRVTRRITIIEHRKVKCIYDVGRSHLSVSRRVMTFRPEIKTYAVTLSLFLFRQCFL